MAQNPIMARYPRLTKGGVGVLLTVLVAVAYFVLFYDEISDSIARQKRDEQTFRSDLARVKQAEFEYHKDLAELTDRQQRQRDLNKILPETTEYPAFLSALQGVANISGVALQAWTPQEEVLQKFFARVPMRLTLQGKFHQVAKFFYGVGQLDRIINVENISLSQPKTQNDELLLKVDCLATAFHTLGTPAPKPGAGVAPPPPGAKQ
ncbi:MAG TPA: type 4a pilus biogenesis protein PilO [Polyangiaceae bacterium]|nr:type 4a pilus biogenesis protein PilO [Polyangiaceae bacterium]